MVAFIDSMNEKVGGSFLGKFFEFEGRGTTFSTEIKAGTATFLTMAYILAINPRLLSDSGASCTGDPFAPEYFDCVEEVRRQYVTSTAIGSFVASLLMGLIANLPIALAPGMGMNAYFTFNVVGWHGLGAVPFDAAITAVMIEGAIFLVLAVTGLRFALTKLIPEPMKLATAPAIGAFLAHLGLQTAEGIGVVVADIATSVTLGGCSEENRTYMTAYTDVCADAGICNFADAYTCDVNGGIMRSGTMWMGILGMMIMAVMLGYKKNGGIIVGILFVTIVSWFRNTAVTFFPDTADGDAKFEYFSKVVNVEPINKLWVQFSGDLGNVGLALVTFFFIDFLDTTGTLLAVVSPLGIVDETGDFPKSRQAFAVDAIATMFGSLFGLSPITSYIESAAGVEAGGKTGMTAVVCSFYFLLSIFFAPILSSIPAWATGGALIIVGALMCRSLPLVQWDKIDHALTAFVTIMLMPLTYSIAYGLIGGLMVWYTFQGVYFLLSFVGIKNPNAVEEEEAEEPEKAKELESDDTPEKADA